VSVAKYSRDELQRLYCEASGVLSSLPLCCIERERLAQAIRAAYYANRAAIACTYNEEIGLKPFEIEEACTYNEEIGLKPFEIEDNQALQADKKKVFEDIGLLMYNCVSNGGRDFLPRGDREILEGLERSIAYSFIEEA